MVMTQLKQHVLALSTHPVSKTDCGIWDNCGMDLIVKIEQHRESAGLKKADMARYFKVESQNYNNWVYRGSLPKEHYAAALKLLNLPSAAQSNVSPAPRPKLIPLISEVNAGAWCESPDNYEPGDAEEWLPAPQNAGDRTFALRVNNDSMTAPYPGQRSYPEGMIIYVDPDKRITNGARVVARANGEYTFKAYVEDAGRKYLKPLNPQYDKIDITDDVSICGVVIGSYLPE